MDKLYPPSIDGTIPAFYSEDGTTAEIVVPFTMNRAVSFEDINGFMLKVKTIQTNSEIWTLESTGDNFTNEEATFFITQQHDLSSKIHYGQFLKLQLAYLDKNNEVGYYSTTGIIKFTSKPIVSIIELQNNNIERPTIPENAITIMSYRPILMKYTGLYQNINDKSEKPYQQQFSLYAGEENNNNVPISLIETSGWFNYDLNKQENNFYSFKNKDIIINSGTPYVIEYKIKTINNLIYTVYYAAKTIKNDIYIKSSLLSGQINIDNGYILLSFDNSGDNSINKKMLLCRKDNDCNNWETITIIDFQNNIENNFKDYTIQQGKLYSYRLLEAIDSIQNSITFSNTIEVYTDFEDCFLYDGKRQLKIKFNPKISSFKTNRLEQKLETIGSRYPFIFRNNIVEYKEFPISGLISYHMDDNEDFITKEELDIISNNQLERTSNPEERSLGNVETLDLVDYNIKAERLFKLKVLDWLGNGEIKLFKSPTEGNYLVRLMNISLSPEDKLNRMIHNFSCTAYEVQEYNYENLSKLIG